jgi:hypothetical protein
MGRLVNETRKWHIGELKKRETVVNLPAFTSYHLPVLPAFTIWKASTQAKKGDNV